MKKNLMVVGTSSGAGKSLLVTALCKIFFDRGYKVCPFKSQNMALNSFVTKEGLEMGRSQVIQARACNLEPLAKMNPILLKPAGNNKIQVILEGKSIGNMSGLEYSSFKESLIPMLYKNYKELENDFDFIILEGAGSPVEINIEQKDISNLEMAKISNSPIILVADIDRGGVFASIYGTIMLMKEEDRKRLIGIVINKFRGNKEVLQKGFEKIYKLTGVKTLGVLPYANIDIEDEDSISDKFSKTKSAAKIKIGVIKLRHASNLTDLNAFSMYDDVEVKFIEREKDFSDFDMLVIPGSKNTIDDMIFLQETKLDKKILEFAKSDSLIFGICGGLQLLGQKINDENEIEGNIEEMSGLSLLNIETKMEKIKNTSQYVGDIKKEGIFSNIKNTKIKGYEIHQGVSYGNEQKLIDDERLIFIRRKNIYATYIHGIFDNLEISDAVVNFLRKNKNLQEEKSLKDYEKYQKEQLDILCKIVNDNIDIDNLEKLIINFKNGENNV